MAAIWLNTIVFGFGESNCIIVVAFPSLPENDKTSFSEPLSNLWSCIVAFSTATIRAVIDARVVRQTIKHD
jgi:hypothetical protein